MNIMYRYDLSPYLSWISKITDCNPLSATLSMSISGHQRIKDKSHHDPSCTIQVLDLEALENMSLMFSEPVSTFILFGCFLLPDVFFSFPFLVVVVGVDI
eukprot:TRINITY_DN14182_c0_g1_i2.p1 TRINITY_DN14182_c0_g1~~TRINITY_DN14182_c0_g1_i2.p1  ORF type:complete len:100 (+),score=8.40 TRINITY_DN14182_c0_g1_i2:233-532(+)